jgi:hypothetical protein
MFVLDTGYRFRKAIMGLKQDSNEQAANEAIIKDIRMAIVDLDYGTVTIKVHNAKISQIEITQKKRYGDNGLVEKGGGI